MTSDISLTHVERLNPEKIKLINFLSFLHGFAQAVTAYLLSSYFMQASGTSNVSVFYLISYSILFMVLLNLHKIVKKIGRVQVLFTFLLAQVILSLILSVIQVSWIGMAIIIIYIIVSNLTTVACDIILECFSEDKLSGRIRGFNLTIMNIGILLGPILSTQVMEKFNFNGIFLVKFFLNMFILAVAYFGLNNFIKKFDYNLSVTGLIKSVIKRKDIMRIYSMSFVLNFFYALMVIYTPIYLQGLGLSWSNIGIIFTIMLLPFVLIQYPIGMLADKKLGEKELIIASLCLMAPSVLTVYFLGTTDVLIWGLVLFMTRIGAAMLEVLNDSYFYKRVDANDVAIIDFYRTAQPLGYIIASIISALMLLFLPLKSVFILVAIVIVAGFYPASRLVDNKGESEK